MEEMISGKRCPPRAQSLLSGTELYAGIGHHEGGKQSGLEEENQEVSNTSHLNGSAICLLDDDPSVLKATGRLLSSAGREVRPFTDPHAFLSYAQTQHPRLAIVDILMPLMHGLEVQRRLRDVSPATRVIILTSKDDLMVRSQAMEAGAAGFFVKPINAEEFLSGIDAVLGTN